MKRNNIFITVAAVLFTGSLVFNAYSYYEINSLEDVKQNVKESVNQNDERSEEESTEKLVRAVNEIVMQSESEIGVNRESTWELAEMIYDLPQVEKKLAFIRGLVTEDGKVYLDLDQVEWFGGEEAEIAAKEDGRPEEWGELPNGFYIRNASDEIERVKLETDAIIKEIKEARQVVVDYTDFIGKELQDRLFTLTFVGGKVVLVEERYRP